MKQLWERVELYPLEIGLNALQNGTGFTFSETFKYPETWILTSFTQVARLAGWNDIAYCITTAFSDRDMMFLMQNPVSIKKACSFAAISTRTMKVFKSALPIFYCKVARKFSFFNSMPMFTDTAFFPMCFCVFLSALSFALGLRITFLCCFVSVGIFLSPLARTFARFYGVFYSIFSNGLSCFIRIICTPFARSFLTTKAALSLQFIFAIWMQRKELSRRREISFTSVAEFKWEGDIQHSDVPFAQFQVVIGRWWNYHFSGATLADNWNYTSQRKELPLD